MSTIRVIAAVAIASLATAVSAQPVGNGFGFRVSGGSPQEPSYLLNSPSVQKELKLSKEQQAKLQKIRDEEENGNHPFFRGINGKSSEQIQQSLEEHARETRERIAKVLVPEQLSRLDEINIQVVGVEALGYTDVAKSLDLTATQQDQLRHLADDTRRRLQELNSTNSELPVSDSRRQTWKAKQDEIIATRKASALALLTDEQRSKFDTLRGEKFDTSTVQRNRKSFRRRGRIEGRGIETPPGPSQVP